MGIYDMIYYECIYCNKKTRAQTKIIGYNASRMFFIGDKISNKKLANCTLLLKDGCEHCKKHNAIVIRSYKIVGVAKEELATVKEELFGEWKEIKQKEDELK